MLKWKNKMWSSPTSTAHCLVLKILQVASLESPSFWPNMALLMVSVADPWARRKRPVTLNKLKISLGLNNFGNIWDNFSTQPKK